MAIRVETVRFGLGRLSGQMPLLALAALSAISALISDRFLSPVNIQNVLMQGAVMAVITIGMTYVIISGGFDLSVGSIVALSGCVAAWVMLEANILLGVLSGIAVGGVVLLIVDAMGEEPPAVPVVACSGDGAGLALVGTF